MSGKKKNFFYLAGVDPSVVPQVDEHDALADARWNRDLYLYLVKEGLP